MSIEEILNDMQMNVEHKMAREEQHELEAADFHERLMCAEDDTERIRICRRWSRVSVPPRLRGANR